MPTTATNCTRGLTLTEILIGTVIVGALAVIVTPSVARRLQDRAAVAAVQSMTSRALERQAASYSASMTYLGTPEELNIPTQTVLGTPVALIAAAANQGAFVVVVAHWRGGACVARGGRVTGSETTNAMICDRSMDAPLTYSLGGSTITIDVDSAIATFASRPGGLGPASAWAADPTEIRGIWLWFDDGAVLGAPRDAPTTMQHTFTGPIRDRKVLLVLERTNGAVWTGRLQFSDITGTGNNLPPEALIQPSTTNIGTGGGITLDGAGSRDPDGVIVTYAWTFSGGIPDQAGPVARLRFSSPGTYLATLTVTDNLGATDSKSVTLTATGPVITNLSPIARATASGVPALVGAPIALNGSTSSDPDGRIVSYEWSVTGIGPVQTFSVASPTVALAGVGTATATLTVTDNEGATDVVSLPLAVTGAFTTPTISITPGALTLRVGIGATFTANLTDADSTTVRWSFGDGVNGGGVSVQHRWSRPGVYTVEAIARDARGATSRGTATVVVSENQQPTGDITFTPSVPAPGDTVTFVGTNLVDPDGSIVFVRWLFDDGTYTEGDSIQRVFTTGGLKRATLVLQDDAGARTTIDTTILVNTAPTCAMTFPLDGFALASNSDITLTATGSDSEGDSFQYRWYLDGALLGTTPAGSFPHTLGAPADTAVFEVECFDALATGSRDTQTGAITNTGPVATLISPPETFTRGVSTLDTLTASAIDAEGHTITTYRWQIDSVTVGTTAVPSFEYTWPATPGSYTAGVAARDTYGMWGDYDVHSGTLTSAEVVQGTVEADDPAALHNSTMTFTAVGFTGATSYTWTINGVSAGTGVSISPTMNVAGFRTIEVTASNGTDSKTASLADYCVLGIPGTNAPPQAWDDTYNSGGLTYWELSPNNKRMRWSYPACGDDSAVVLQSIRVEAGPWSAYNDYATLAGTRYNVPDMPARASGTGTPNIFYRYGIQITAAGGTIRGPLITRTEWETVP